MLSHIIDCCWWEWGHDDVSMVMLVMPKCGPGMSECGPSTAQTRKTWQTCCKHLSFRCTCKGARIHCCSTLLVDLYDFINPLSDYGSSTLTGKLSLGFHTKSFPSGDARDWISVERLCSSTEIWLHPWQTQASCHIMCGIVLCYHGANTTIWHFMQSPTVALFLENVLCRLCGLNIAWMPENNHTEFGWHHGSCKWSFRRRLLNLPQWETNSIVFNLMDGGCTTQIQ